MTSPVKLGTAFIPVRDPGAASDWYEQALGLRSRDVNDFAAVLEADGQAVLTLMGPRSGIAADPGLDWATCNFVVDDLHATRDRLDAGGHVPSAVDGAPEVCLFFTVRDPDGNTLLVVDR